jgi:periplasmic protein TonB
MLARVRWGNVALAATIVGVLVLVAAWPALREQAPRPPAPGSLPVAATLPARPTAGTPPPPEFGGAHTAPVRAHRPAPKRRPRRRPTPPARHHRRHRHVAAPMPAPSPVPTQQPPPPAQVPPPPAAPARRPQSGVTAEFGRPQEF